MRATKRASLAVVTAMCTVGAVAVPVTAHASGGRTVFVESAVEHADNTVTLPVHRGRADGAPFWYVVLDASTSEAADRFGANRADKLANVGSGAVQSGHFDQGELVVDAGVDFGPDLDVANGVPGSVGEPGYSPLVRLPDGTVLDAPQIANATGLHDKVVTLSPAAHTVTLRETEGRSRGNVVHYVSTDASKAEPAALEGSTLAPRLDAAPTPGADGTAPPGRPSPPAGGGRPTPSVRASRRRWPTDWTRSTCSPGCRTRAATARCGTSTSPSGQRQRRTPARTSARTSSPKSRTSPRTGWSPRRAEVGGAPPTSS